MRDDDPKSINDDYVRTFTVSSNVGQNLQHDEFEITFRNVGVVTDFLFKQQVRAGLEVPLKGFGGTFEIPQPAGVVVPFVAGGVGITPLLSYIPQLDLTNVRLFWTINIRDIGLVEDTFTRNPSLMSSTVIFISGIDSSNVQTTASIFELGRSKATLVTRRMVASDIQLELDLASTWYICAGKALRHSLLQWLPGKEVVFEDFDY